jgi:hypothetical protein
MGFKLGQTVYLKTDSEQHENTVIAKREFFGGTVTYTIGCNGSYIDIYECELSTELDVLKKLDVTRYEDTE